MNATLSAGRRATKRVLDGVLARLPTSVRAQIKHALLRASGAIPGAIGKGNLYAELYEAQGQRFPREVSIGEGDFDLIGRIELGLLIQAGAKPGDTIVDFGCGTGRLAVHLIPWLAGGHYVGIDIAQSMLDRAGDFIAERVPEPKARVTWRRQTAEHFDLNDASVDLMCAFSVFTHMELEDMYRYLRAAHRVVKPNGTFVFSCLPISLDVARKIFLESAGRDLNARWRAVRNVVTSTELVEAVVDMAGWKVAQWFPGDQPNIVTPGESKLWPLGQSSCVLRKP
jgi:ubiquinone/menaquinone biosynthesis C-methylase UbiE